MTLNRFILAACIVTVSAMLSGWAHAGQVCTVTERLVTTPAGEQFIVRKVVCEVSR